jgi:hypothetical protein
MRSPVRALVVALAALACAALACAACAATDGGEGGGPPGTGGGDTYTPSVDPPPPADYAGFAAALGEIQAEAAALSVDDFLAIHGVPGEPLAALSYSPAAAAFMEEIDAALALTDGEAAAIETAGFAVLDRTRYATFLEAYTAAWEADLPVLVTADSVLHAVHRSYDELLKSMEQQILVPALDRVLAAAHAHLATLDAGGDALLADALGDADQFLTIARTLLAGERAAKARPDTDDEAIDALLAVVAAEQGASEVWLFGSLRVFDASQYRPRGHYEDDETLRRYFRAMMWLGRVDLRLRVPDPFDAARWKFDRRALTVAYILQRAVTDGGALGDWQLVDRLIGMMVGERDSMDVPAMARYAADAGIARFTDVTQGDAAALETQLVQGGYGVQRIASHWLRTDPFSPEVTPLPLSFTFLGQRYVVDSHVFSQVVYDRIVVDTPTGPRKMLRMLPDPRDALFVLGADRLAPRLADQLAEYRYQGNLHTLRWLVDSYPDDFWTANLYNRWLQALRALNAPTLDPVYPEPMRTEAWLDRTTNTQLASWAELRHDTQLYAKQSYTGGIACTYPDGYVEPYPDLWAALAAYARDAKTKLADAPFPDGGQRARLAAYFDGFAGTMDRLEALARKELAGERFDAADVTFLEQVIHMDPGCGDPGYTGWYADLFWPSAEYHKAFEPTIADVHTDANDTDVCGAPCAESPRVLHVGTGHVNLMVFTTDSCEGPRAYVGPVSSYYELAPPRTLSRWTDSEWKQAVGGAERPPWTGSFVVK